MSFILDALRKSEHARQRETGPGLAEIPVAAARPKKNLWATAAVVLLLVNLLAVGVLLLRRAQQNDAPATTVSTASTGTSVAPSPTDTGIAAAATAQPSLVAADTGPVTQGAAPPRAAPAAAAESRNPLADEVGAGIPEPSLQAAASAVPDGPPAVTRQGSARPGSVVYAPVPEAEDPPYVAPVPARSAAAPPASAPAMPGADEVIARGGVPPLHLDLHVYANEPQQRFVFINSRKYREGDTLAEGPVVEQITTEGAVLNFRGSRFKLSND
jgi:general secretion pathway protein B